MLAHRRPIERVIRVVAGLGNEYSAAVLGQLVLLRLRTSSIFVRPREILCVYHITLGFSNAVEVDVGGLDLKFVAPSHLGDGTAEIGKDL